MACINLSIHFPIHPDDFLLQVNDLFVLADQNALGIIVQSAQQFMIHLTIAQISAVICFKPIPEDGLINEIKAFHTGSVFRPFELRNPTQKTMVK